MMILVGWSLLGINLSSLGLLLWTHSLLLYFPFGDDRCVA